ncbi:DMT family transporter [Phosphitispora sp. TUW77]|uniref:DMT family transporter n=1 Tax=Phosphitispora sp. TUW77 TaxID=3152361 RepID=UPI003AB8AD22
MALIFYILIAAGVGAASSIQVILNSNLNRTVNLPLTVLVVNTIAMISSLVIYIVFSRQSFTVLKDANWYAFLGGVLGLVIVMGSTFLIPKLGVSITIGVIIVGQLTFAMIADHYGLAGVRQIPVDPVRMAALLLMLFGVYLFYK